MKTICKGFVGCCEVISAMRGRISTHFSDFLSSQKTSVKAEDGYFSVLSVKPEQGHTLSWRVQDRASIEGWLHMSNCFVERFQLFRRKYAVYLTGSVYKKTILITWFFVCNTSLCSHISFYFTDRKFSKCWIYQCTHTWLEVRLANDLILH